MNEPTNDTNQITEILEDGTIYHFDLSVCNEAAEEAIQSLWEKEGKVVNFDYTATVFNLFARSIQTLSNSGWSTEDLFQEVANYSEADDNVCECCGKRRNDPVHDHDEDEDEE